DAVGVRQRGQGGGRLPRAQRPAATADDVTGPGKRERGICKLPTSRFCLCAPLFPMPDLAPHPPLLAPDLPPPVPSTPRCHVTPPESKPRDDGKGRASNGRWG